MKRMLAFVVALACCCAGSASVAAQSAPADTVLVLKGGVELRGQFIGYKDGLFNLRLPDGRTVGYPAAQVDQMRPFSEAPPSAAPSATPSVRPSAPPPRTAAPSPPRGNVPAMPTPAATGLDATACGPTSTKFTVTTDKTQHPIAPVSPDKAIIYVVRPSLVAKQIQTRLGVDGAWAGVNGGNTYFLLTIDPGAHAFCSEAQDRSVLSLTVEAGKTYYLQQKISTGMTKSTTTLQAVTEQEGRTGLMKANLSVWKEAK